MTIEPDTSSLANRILDCFPSGTYALSALLRLLDIVETREVETAAVECRVEPRLLVNPDFVERSAKTPEKLLVLVMHELYHVLLGHTRLFPRVTRVDNLVFDAVINALLCRMFPAKEHLAFFTELYDDKRFPDCLLRPPAGWSPDAPLALPPPLAGTDMRRIAEVYRALYSPRGAAYEELYEALRETVTEFLARSVLLLGDHGQGGASADGLLEHRSPILLDIVRQIVEQWPQPPDPVAGRSLSDLLRSESVQPDRRPSNRAVLRDLIRRVADLEGEAGARRITAQHPREVMTPLPVPDRRSIVLAALGAPPILHRGGVAVPQRVRAGSRVHVYVDVSGSIGNFKGALFGAVHDCRQWVHATIHLFSTRVADVSLSELRRGICETTGGTDIACVAKHIREHRVRRAVLLTDGYVGPPVGEYRETLQGIKLGVALTPDNSSRDDLADVADHWVQLHR